MNQTSIAGSPRNPPTPRRELPVRFAAEPRPSDVCIRQVFLSDAFRCALAGQKFNAVLLHAFLRLHWRGDAGEATNVLKVEEPFRSEFSLPDGRTVGIETDAQRTFTSICLQP